jgi:hypothetical protein
MSLSISRSESQTKIKSNVFTDTAGIIAREGIHQATVISTQHLGRRKTVYGPKDFQMFILRVSQCNDDGEREIAEIHQQYHRSFSPQASLTAFLGAFGIKAHRGMTFDFDDLVGKKLNLIVTHATDSHGVKHANVKPIVPVGGAR